MPGPILDWRFSTGISNLIQIDVVKARAPASEENTRVASKVMPPSFFLIAFNFWSTKLAQMIFWNVENSVSFFHLTIVTTRNTTTASFTFAPAMFQGLHYHYGKRFSKPLLYGFFDLDAICERCSRVASLKGSKVGVRTRGRMRNGSTSPKDRVFDLLR